MSDAWPSPDSPPGPLPRIEDLPIADQGYDQEAVRLAFDSFYRHAAQLDASLRALEAVEVFRRDADALRNDLRALRTLGLGSSEPSWSTPRYEPARREIPGVAQFRPAVVVALMAGAFVVVALSEWLAARGRFVAPATAFVGQGEPAPFVEAPAPGRGAEPDEDTEPEALTIVASPEEVDDAAEAADPWEAGVVENGAEPETEPELAERGGLFRRRRR